MMTLYAAQPFTPAVPPTRSTVGRDCYELCAVEVLVWDKEALRAAPNCRTIPAEMLPESYTLAIRGETSSRTLVFLLRTFPFIRYRSSERWSKETLKLGSDMFWNNIGTTPEQRQLAQLRADVALLHGQIEEQGRRGSDVAATAFKGDTRRRNGKGE